MRFFEKKSKDKTKVFRFDFFTTTPKDYQINFNGEKVKAEIINVIKSGSSDSYNLPVCEFHVMNELNKARQDLKQQKVYHDEICKVICKENMVTKEYLIKICTELNALLGEEESL